MVNRAWKLLDQWLENGTRQMARRPGVAAVSISSGLPAGLTTTFGATLTPMQGSIYTDAAGVREATRQAINHWIRTSGRFDAVIDFDRAVRDPRMPAIIAPAFDSGDHLHLNPAGYQALAQAVDLDLFRMRADGRPPLDRGDRESGEP